MKIALLDFQKVQSYFNELLQTGDVTVSEHDRKEFENEASRRGLQVRIEDAGIIDDDLVGYCYVLA